LYVHNRISNGDLLFLDMSLESSKKFVSHLKSILEHCVPHDQQGLTSRLTGAYLSQILPSRKSLVSHTNTSDHRSVIPSPALTGGVPTQPAVAAPSCRKTETTTETGICESSDTIGRAWTEDGTTRHVFQNHTILWEPQGHQWVGWWEVEVLWKMTC
jgi:hypothetical protein